MAAVVNLKSTTITNATANPVVNTSSTMAQGRLLAACGAITPNTDDTSTSTYRFFRVPSNCRMSKLLLTAADFTTAGAIDVGLYRTTEDGGAVVDADLFASAIDMSAGSGVGTDAQELLESGTYTAANREKQLWEVLGLSSDPGVWYDVVATSTITFNGGQTMFLEGYFVV
jgi:hypothetical protein